MSKVETYNNITILFHKDIIEYPKCLFDNIYVCNEHNKIINNFGFYNQPVVKIHMPTKFIGTFSINKLFLAYSNKFAEVSNKNFYTEFYPYIYYYKISNYTDTLLGIPESLKSDKLYEIIDKFLIKRENILWIQNNVKYIIDNFATSRYIPTFTGKLYLNELSWCIQALSYLHRSFSQKDYRISKNDYRILYLEENVNLDNDNIENKKETRYIINSDNVYNYCKFNDIQIDALYNKKTLIGKTKVFTNNVNFISMYNDDLIELVFAKDVRNLFILNNKNTVFLNDTVKFIFERIFKHKINIHVICDMSSDKTFEQPFNVNIKELHNKLTLINPDLRYNEYFEDIGDITKYQTDEDFLVNYLFNILLKRLPNSREFTYHLDRVKKKGRLEVYNEFLNCNEYKAINKNKKV
ncbi:hypothetical protein QKU48_gp1112 [Fadolivirus algeromassiliense]|jgi:hypothetical protein|uniref:Uncharacterized protein n=1 Tax=Fadolivirus FV1/VV64 TaxID=3070911 RepID=A0A7D3UTU0_9VIRU|nr:hypothetical protein QKU48_gp1112 [Fadolivirus algeromassiliense]QKF94570.1 hypothetical protein Fadolivirus_1_1112 [Fadolivirus FV1/VV64]